MGEVKSETKNDSGFIDAVIGTETWKTTISDGKDSVSNRGVSPEQSQQRASESWSKR